MENKWDLLVREVVGAQISPYWAHGRLEVPEMKWVRTNNTNSIHSAQYTSTPAYLPDPPSDFSEGLVPRLNLYSLLNVKPLEWDYSSFVGCVMVYVFLCLGGGLPCSNSTVPGVPECH